MKPKITAEQATQMLNATEPFWLNGGGEIHSLSELAQAKLANEAFAHHVNKEKNDFAAWNKGCVRDEALAAAVAKVKSPSALQKKVAARVAELQKIAYGKSTAAKA